MSSEAIEMYIGTIYRLRESPHRPVSLRKIQQYFQFSPISIHEMIVRLEEQGYLLYQPYKGVLLTETGDRLANSLIRRHRIWERFLVDALNFPPDQAHQLADQLEHASSEEVTDRLSSFLGFPETCPHGSFIPPITANESE